MARATRCVRFACGSDGRIAVRTTPDFRPIEDFLGSDVDPTDLRFLATRARGAERAPWGFGGDSCHVTVDGDDVFVENDFTGQNVALSRDEFLKILEEYAAVVSGR